jgi:hypothetical protein
MSDRGRYQHRSVPGRVLDEAVAGALGRTLEPEDAPSVLEPAERFRRVQALLKEIQAPWAMTSIESRKRIRALADRLEGRRP